MKKVDVQFFDILWQEEKEIYQKVNERLNRIFQVIIFDPEKFSKKVHFSYDISLPNTLCIRTNQKTEEQIIEEILRKYFETIMSQECQEIIPELINWFLNDTQELNWHKIKNFYRQKRIQQKTFTKQEENYYFLIYLNQLFGSQFFLILTNKLIAKEILKKQSIDYLDNLFYPEKNIKSEEDVLNYVRNYHYGWFDEKKILHQEGLKDWKKDYYIYPVDFILEQGIGCCVDFARIKAYFLTQLGIPYKNMLLKYLDGEKIHYHAQTFFEKHGIWYKMTDTYIEEMDSFNKIYELNYGDEVLDRKEFDLTIENQPIQEVIIQLFGETRKKE